MSNAIFTVILTSYTILLGIIAYFIKDKLNSIEQRLKAVETEQNSMKTNYLSRFESVKDHVSVKVDELKEAINSIKINMAELKQGVE